MHLAPVTLFILGSRPPDKKTFLVFVTSPLRETPTDLQVIIPSVSCVCWLSSSEEISLICLRSRKSLDKFTQKSTFTRKRPHPWGELALRMTTDVLKKISSNGWLPATMSPRQATAYSSSVLFHLPWWMLISLNFVCFLLYTFVFDYFGFGYFVMMLFVLVIDFLSLVRLVYVKSPFIVPYERNVFICE